jgi:carbonic anhydrase
MAVKPLPNFLIHRYNDWKSNSYSQNKNWYKKISVEDQRPKAMVISCCDSRVHVTAIFGAEQGEFFIHRNIANLIPPFSPNGDYHGTSAAIEYAVTSLQISKIIVLGHSNCGGVNGCHDMCAGKAPELEKESSFIGRWMDILRPGYEKVKHILDEEERKEALGKEAVLISLKNLQTFPFIKDAIRKDELNLYGLWTHIGQGNLEHYIEGDGFKPV